MKYTVKPTSLFNKDLRRAAKRGCDIDALKAIVKTLAAGEELPPQYKDHPLQGNFKGCRECHIEPDWLLIYKISGDSLILYLMRTGTHSDLFDK